MDEELLAQALELTGRHASALAKRAEVPARLWYPREDGPGDRLPRTRALVQPLQAAALERRIAAIGRDHPDHLAGTDAVHGDFHHENLLDPRRPASPGSSTGTAPAAAITGSTW